MRYNVIQRTGTMQSTRSPDSLRTRRLAPDEGIDALRTGGSGHGEGGPATGLEAPTAGFVVEANARPLLYVMLDNAPARRFASLLPRRLRVNHVRLVPAESDPPSIVVLAVRRALGELVFGEPRWHVLRVENAPGDVLDAWWRLATPLGYSCMIAQTPSPERTSGGSILATPPALTIYHPGLKGSLARARDARVLARAAAALGDGIRKAARRLRSPSPGISPGSRFFALDLDVVGESPGRDKGLSFHEVTAMDVAKDPLRYGSSIKRVEQSLHRGDRCFATLLDGELAHHHWVSVDPGFLRRNLPAELLDRPTAYPFDAFTFPAFRGRGLQAATHRFLALHFRSEGIERFAVRISAFNTSSIRGILKAGYSEVVSHGESVEAANDPD